MYKEKFKIKKIILIAFVLFLVKHFLQAIIEWTDIIPVRPKAYIWGEWSISIVVIIKELINVFWLYILTVILFYFILKKELLWKISNFKINISLSIIITLFLLLVHQHQFPYKKMLSRTTPTRFNYAFFEELIIYSVVGFLLVYLVRTILIKSSIKQK
ncbi:MAG: hypothetical protein HRT69_02520 [Flavobacteriaceae bacterium]|nr:hypothetical protein [Flavobacteriaceae bacterium]